MYTSSKSIVHSSIIFILCNSKLGCASSFSPILPSSTHAFSSRTATRKRHQPKKRNHSVNGDVVNNHIDSPKTRHKYSSTDVALSLSGGSVAASSAAAAIEFGGGGPFSMLLAGLNSFYMSYPLLSAITTCSVKGCLADCIAQRRNNAEEASNDYDESSLGKAKSSNKPKFSLRRNAAYILYGGGILGVFCDVMYNFVYPFLFGGMDGIVHLVAVVVFDNLISAPLIWLPPVYFVKAILYGQTLKSGIQKYSNDVQHNGLLKQYWTIWFPAQIVNFSLVPAHLRIAFMAGISFFWMILLSCISSNNKKTK